MAFITFVTTCRGRLDHLRETLPTLVRQPDAAVVVVDYSCPDASGDWVEANFPQVEVVRSAGNPRFELARARNLGAARVRSPWVCFIDVDTRVGPAFGARLKPLLAPGYFYCADPRTPDTWGTTVCSVEDFLDIGGYDEVIQGWGKDDEDFYARLVMAGVRYSGFPGDTIEAVKHSDTERVAHYDVKDHWLSASINHVYCRAKIDIMLLQQAPLSLDTRKKLYAEVHNLVKGAHERGESATLTLPLLTQQTRMCGPLNAKLVYTLPKAGGNGRPAVNASSVVPNPARFRQREP
jgi:glycosyltransferase involved in cell wall biosynthesis